MGSKLIPNIPYKSDETKIISEEITKLLQKGVTQNVEENKGIFFHCVYKKKER